MRTVAWPHGYEPSRFVVSFPDFLRAHGVVHFTQRELADVGRLTTVTDPKRIATIGELLGEPLDPSKPIKVALTAPPPDCWTAILPTLHILNDLRAASRGPIDVNGAWRDPLYNAAYGGAPNSQHLSFAAVDFEVRTMTPIQARAWLEQHPAANTIGLGYYRTFTHLDTRGRRARWGTGHP